MGGCLPPKQPTSYPNHITNYGKITFTKFKIQNSKRWDVKRERERIYKSNGGDNAVENSEEMKYTILPNKRSVHVVPPIDGIIQMVRHHRRRLLRRAYNHLRPPHRRRFQNQTHQIQNPQNKKGNQTPKLAISLLVSEIFFFFVFYFCLFKILPLLFNGRLEKNRYKITIININKHTYIYIYI